MRLKFWPHADLKHTGVEHLAWLSVVRAQHYPALLQLSCKVMQKSAPWPAEALTIQGDLDLRLLHINITGNVLTAKVRSVRP